MKTLKIDWLLCEDPSSDIEIPDRNVPLVRSIRQLRGSPVLATTERVLFDDGMYLFGSRVGIDCRNRHEYFPIAEVEGSFDEPAFMVRSVSHGKCIQEEQIPPISLNCHPGTDLFRYAREFRFTIQCCQSGASAVSFTSLCIAQPRIEELIGQDNFAKLIERLEIDRAPAIRAYEMQRAISDPLRNALLSKFQGRMRLLFAHGKILEYLCALSDAVLSERDKPACPTILKKQVEQLHFDLKKIEGKIPKLNELARIYGFPARSLNQEFKQTYGVSIPTFVSEHRLNQAHRALVHSGIAIKTLSDRLGYSHVNHFTTAFSRKFGYPPGHLRRVVSKPEGQ